MIIIIRSIIIHLLINLLHNNNKIVRNQFSSNFLIKKNLKKILYSLMLDIYCISPFSNNDFNIATHSFSNNLFYYFSFYRSYIRVFIFIIIIYFK